MQKYMDSQKNYKTNAYNLSKKIKEIIATKWDICFKKWDYKK